MGNQQDIVLITYDEIVRKTHKAILFKIADKEIWIPVSLIDDIWEDDNQVGLPVWFCIQHEIEE